MRAVRYEGPGKGVVFVRSAPDPRAPVGEAIIRPRKVAIGGAERAVALGLAGPDPITLGHEFVGIVESVNPSKSQAERARTMVGKRVVGSAIAVCGECDLCRAGLSNHCRQRTTLGAKGRDGCFADLFRLPINSLFLIPDAVEDEKAVFAEALASAVQATQQIRIENKPYITILGDGPLGLLCAQLMNRLNASVRVVGRHERKMELAEKWGIKQRNERDVGRRADQDVVVDCTGTAAGFELALKLVRPRGKVLLKTDFMWAEPATPVDFTPIVTNEIEVVGSRSGPISEALRLLATSQAEVTGLISRRMRLDDAVEALKLAADPATLKIVMDV